MFDKYWVKKVDQSFNNVIEEKNFFYDYKKQLVSYQSELKLYNLDKIKKFYFFSELSKFSEKNPHIVISINNSSNTYICWNSKIYLENHVSSYRELFDGEFAISLFLDLSSIEYLGAQIYIKSIFESGKFFSILEMKSLKYNKYVKIKNINRNFFTKSLGLNLNELIHIVTGEFFNNVI